MDMNAYLKAFETEVLVNAFINGIMGGKNEPTPVRPVKLNKTPFGHFIGHSFKFSDPLAFNYYGMVKVSTGVLEVVQEAEAVFPGLKLMNVPVINFSSIRKEHIYYLAPDLLSNFDQFKEHLIALRWGE